MKIIHHKLEDGDKDPIEFNAASYSIASNYIDDAMYFGEFRPVNDFDKELHPSKGFLMAHGNDECASGGEVVVSNSPFWILKTLGQWTSENCLDTSIIHLQEYASFESAYSVALAMREGHPLCYDATED